MFERIDETLGSNTLASLENILCAKLGSQIPLATPTCWPQSGLFPGYILGLSVRSKSSHARYETQASVSTRTVIHSLGLELLRLQELCQLKPVQTAVVAREPAADGEGTVPISCVVGVLMPVDRQE